MSDSRLADQREHTGYRPDIDGMRAVAVLSVMLYHAGFGVPGGFVGVDVFFVISGYLITQGIMQELAVGRFTLQRFWERRLRRILPASLVMMIAVLTMGHWLLLPEDYQELAQATLSQLGFGGNFFYWAQTGYFATPAETKPLLHTWSLAVEEQFYLLLPLLLVMLAARARRYMFPMILVLTVTSFMACVILTPRYPSAAFYLLPTRAWELLAGCVIAMLPAPRGQAGIMPQLWAVASMTALLSSLVFFQSSAAFPGAMAAVPVVSSATLIHLHRTQSTWIGRALAQRWLVGIGLISYSLYLWHWPLMALTRYLLGPVPWQVMVLPFLLTFPVAFVSWKLVEQPVRKRMDWQGWGLYQKAVLAMSAPCMAALAIWIGQGWPSRLPRQQPLPEMPQRLGDRFGTSAVDFELEQLPRLGVDGVEPDLLMWGDSHAQALAPLVDELAREAGLAGYMVARGGTPTLVGGWRRDATDFDKEDALRWNRNVLDVIQSRAWRAILVVVAWQNYSGETGLVDAESAAIFPDDSLQVLRRQINATASAMRTQAPVFWIRQPPRQDRDLAATLRKRALHAWTPAPGRGLTRQQFDQQTSHIAEIFVELQDHQHFWIDPSAEFFDDQGFARLFKGDEFCYVDDNHVSRAGARLYYAQALTQIFQSLKPP